MFEKYNNWRHKHWSKGFDEGSQWAMDTFAWTVETRMIDGASLEEAYDFAKSIYANADNVNSRIKYWKESHV